MLQSVSLMTKEHCLAIKHKQSFTAEENLCSEELVEAVSEASMQSKVPWGNMPPDLDSRTIMCSYAFLSYTNIYTLVMPLPTWDCMELLGMHVSF